MSIVQYRIWHLRSLRGQIQDILTQDVSSPQEAIPVLDALAHLDLQDDDVGFNAQGLLTLENGEWVEWVDEDGNDIEELRQ